MFLRKYIQYAKRFDPVFNDEAKSMLNEYFIALSNTVFGTHRKLETLFKLARATARLKLKEIVDVDDARETMELFNIILEQYQCVVAITKNPKEITYSECITILKESEVGLTLEELAKKACKNKEQIKNYLNPNLLRLNKNRKLRSVFEMLKNHSNIKIVKEKPIVLLWRENEDRNKQKYDKYDSCDICDICDANSMKIENFKNNYKNCKHDKNNTKCDQKNNNSIDTLSYKSHMSHSLLEHDNMNYVIKSNKLKTKTKLFTNPLITESDLLGSDYNYDPEIINNIDRFNGTDRWFCKNCKTKGDKWFMMKHLCNKKRNS